MGKHSDPMDQAIEAMLVAEGEIGKLQAENAALSRKLEEAQASTAECPRCGETVTGVPASESLLVERDQLVAHVKKLQGELSLTIEAASEYQAEIKRLEARWSESVDMVTEIEGKYQEAQAALKAKEEEIGRLRKVVEAARPFVALLQPHNVGKRDDYPIFGINGVIITVGHLRKLEQALADLEGKG